MTAADLLAHCQAFREEHGILVLCDVLETIFETNEHSACVELLDDDEDEMEAVYFTIQ